MYVYSIKNREGKVLHTVSSEVQIDSPWVQARAVVRDAVRKRVSLAGADLHGVNFFAEELRSIDLRDADLSGCSFKDALMERACLRGAKGLETADFTGAVIEKMSGTHEWVSVQTETMHVNYNVQLDRIYVQVRTRFSRFHKIETLAEFEAAIMNLDSQEESERYKKEGQAIINLLRAAGAIERKYKYQVRFAEIREDHDGNEYLVEDYNIKLWDIDEANMYATYGQPSIYTTGNYMVEIVCLETKQVLFATRRRMYNIAEDDQPIMQLVKVHPHDGVEEVVEELPYMKLFEKINYLIEQNQEDYLAIRGTYTKRDNDGGAELAATPELRYTDKNGYRFYIREISD